MIASVDVGLAVAHVATGLWFANSGFRKCFVPSTRESVQGVLTKYNVPRLAQRAVVCGQLLGGLGLLFGCLTQAAAAGLLVIMFGAYKLDTWPAVKARQVGKPRDFSRLLSNAGCTTEAQMIVILATLLFAGAGAYSLDALLFG